MGCSCDRRLPPTRRTAAGDRLRLQSRADIGTARHLDRRAYHAGRTNRRDFRLTTHSRQISPDGTSIVTVGGDGRVSIWDSTDGALIRSFGDLRDTVNNAAFNNDGTRLATTSQDGTVRIWDPANGDLVQTLVGQGGSTRSAWFSMDGRRIATGSSNLTARVWDLSPGRVGEVELMSWVRDSRTSSTSMLSANDRRSGRRVSLSASAKPPSLTSPRDREWICPIRRGQQSRSRRTAQACVAGGVPHEQRPHRNRTDPDVSPMVGRRGV
jgi:WD40 repeat protein